MTVFLVSLYAIYKLHTLVNFGEYKVQERYQLEYHDPLDQFGSEEGFAFAMGLTDFNSSGKEPLEPIEDPSIGSIRFFAKNWGDQAPYDDFLHELDSKPCDFAKDINDVEGSNT